MIDETKLNLKLDNLTTLLTSVNDRLARVETKTEEISDSNSRAHANISKLDNAIAQCEQNIQNVVDKIAEPGPTESRKVSRDSEKDVEQAIAPLVDLFSLLGRDCKSKPSAWEQMLSGEHEVGQSAAEVQRDFEQVKEGLTKVKLPSDLKIFHSATGIKQENKPAYNVLKQGISYHDSAAKWMATHLEKFEEGAPELGVSRESFHELHTILMAQASAYRSEYATILVAGSTNPKVQQFYRLFEKNPTIFTDTELQHLVQAVELSGMEARANPQRGSNNYNRGRGYAGNNWRGGYQNNSNRGGFGGYGGYGGNSGFGGNSGYGGTFQNRGVASRPYGRFGGGRGSATAANEGDNS